MQLAQWDGGQRAAEGNFAVADVATDLVVKLATCYD